MSSVNKIGQGRYEIHDKLGSGGMAEVYRATDTTLDREVAIKLLSINFKDNQELIGRFEREARFVARLEHPHIVRLYDYGVDENTNQPYLVMQLMQQETLLERIDQLSQDEIWKIIKQMSGALEAAHQAGIIHRDIKPSNILFDQTGNAYLSDFGIARRTEQSTAVTGQRVIGTPQYMSPEQCRPGLEITSASDQYSLAVLTFQMLTKSPLYAGDTMQVMYQHLNESPPFEKLTAQRIPMRVIKSLRIALSKKPELRFSSMQAFANGLLLGEFENTPGPIRKKTPQKPLQRTVTPEPKKRSNIKAKSSKGSKTRQPRETSPLPDAKRQNTERKSDIRRSSPRPREVESAIKPISESTSPPWLKWAIGGAVALVLVIAGFFLSRDTETLEATPPPTSETTEIIETVSLANGISIYPSDTSYDLGDTDQMILLSEDAPEVMLIESSLTSPVALKSPSGILAQLTTAGLMGIQIDQATNRFELHCLSGSCQLDGDVDGQLALKSGEASLVGHRGIPSEKTEANYTPFISLNRRVATAEAVVVADTPTPTETPTLMPTEEVVVQALPDGIEVYPESLEYEVNQSQTAMILPAQKSAIVLISDGVSFSIRNQAGAEALINSTGVIGIASQIQPYQYEVHCLSGTCTVVGDSSGVVELIEGQSSIISSSGVPSDPGAADYDRFAQVYQPVANLVTPTPTVTATATQKATPTQVPATNTPAVISPTNTPPPPANPFDLDLDGVLHNPENGQYDLCQDAQGTIGNCGCPADAVPAACGGSGGGGGGATATPIQLP